MIDIDSFASASKYFLTAVNASSIYLDEDIREPMQDAVKQYAEITSLMLITLNTYIQCLGYILKQDFDGKYIISAWDSEKYLLNTVYNLGVHIQDDFSVEMAASVIYEDRDN